MMWNVCNVGWGGSARAVEVNSMSGGHGGWGYNSGIFWDLESCDETLRHVFDQVRVTDGLQIQPNVALSHPSFSIYYGIGYIEWHRMLKLKKKQQGDWYQKKRGPLRKNWHGLHRVFGEVHTRIALCFNPGGLLLMVPGSQSST